MRAQIRTLISVVEDEVKVDKLSVTVTVQTYGERASNRKRRNGSLQLRVNTESGFYIFDRRAKCFEAAVMLWIVLI